MFTSSIRLAISLLIVGLSTVGAQRAIAQSTTADVVYGQLGSFTTNTANLGGISANSLDNPKGSALDSSGSLYVVDTDNNRALFYPPAAPPRRGSTGRAAASPPTPRTKAGSAPTA